MTDLDRSRSQRPRRRFRSEAPAGPPILAVPLTALVLMAGCAQDDASASTGPTSTTTRTTTVTTTSGGSQTGPGAEGPTVYAAPAPGVREGHASQPGSAPPAAVGAPGGGGLAAGGGASNFGRFSMSMGFQPDPTTIRVTSGGDLNAAAGGPGCAGWVTAQPDVIIDFTAMTGFLRFAFRPDDSREDATLVINDPQGDWYCNDDAVGLMPMVDFADARPGQYDIWVGSYESGAYVTGSLLVTELSSVTP